MALELTVPGVPVSAQAHNAKKRVAWRETVAQASVNAVSGACGADAAWSRVVIVYFFEHDIGMDVDNLAKPILDGLIGSAISSDANVK